MRVLHVLSGLYAAGIESLALQMVRHAPIGVDNELLNTDSAIQALAPAVDELLAAGRLQAVHQWTACDGPRLAWRSFRHCRHRRPDALLIYPCQRPMLWLALGARLAGVRRQAVHLGNPAPTEPTKLAVWHRLLRWFQRLGVVAVPCSQAIVDSLQPLPRGLCLGPVIANGCDTAAIAERAVTARDKRSPDAPRWVLMVARLDPIKDQDTLLRAFAAVRRSGWQLQLVGEGPEESRLKTLAESLGLEPAEIFLGRRSDVPELLGQTDVFAFSTTSAEGFGIALIEAMAAGLPLIASDVPACREVLMGGAAGDLLPPGDVEAWKARLAQLMDSLDERAQLASRSMAHAESFDIESTAQGYFELLRP